MARLGLVPARNSTWRTSLNKRLFGVLIEDLAVGELPEDLTGTWQIVRLAAGRDHVMLRAVLPITHEEVHVPFRRRVCSVSSTGLEEAGLDPKYFAWPPAERSEPAALSRPASARSRGRRHFLWPRRADRRGARQAARLARDHAAAAPRHPRRIRCRQIVVPARRPVSAAQARRPQFSAAADDPAGAGGDHRRDGSASLRSKARSRRLGIPIARADLRVVIQGRRHKAQAAAAGARRQGDANGSRCRRQIQATDADPFDRPGRRVVPRRGAGRGASRSSTLLRDLLKDDAPAMIAVFTIRSDNYERLQLAEELEGVRQDMLSLPPMPKGSYAEVIKGPARRLQGTVARARDRGRAGRCAARGHRSGRRQGRVAVARLHAGAALRRVPRRRRLSSSRSTKPLAG